MESERYKECNICNWFIEKTNDERFNDKTMEEEHSYDGYCHRYPQKIKVKRGDLCGEWLDQKNNCQHKGNDGSCNNTTLQGKRFCKDFIWCSMNFKQKKLIIND